MEPLLFLFLIVLGVALVLVWRVSGGLAPPDVTPPKPAPNQNLPVRPKIHRPVPKAMIEPRPRGTEVTGHAHIIDGDTISIGRTKVRLAGIDAPEIDMPFGRKSKWAMVDICKGQKVRVVMHGETSHDRQVGTGYLPDGRDIGAELVKRGLAIDCAFYSGGKYRAFEPEGARRRLANGAFGHRSIARRAG